MSVILNKKTNHYYIDKRIKLDNNGNYYHLFISDNDNLSFEDKTYVSNLEETLTKVLVKRINDLDKLLSSSLLSLNSSNKNNKNIKGLDISLFTLEKLYSFYISSRKDELSTSYIYNLDRLFYHHIYNYFNNDINRLYSIEELTLFRNYLGSLNVSTHLKNQILSILIKLIEYSRKLRLINSEDKDDLLLILVKFKSKVEIKKVSRNKYTSKEELMKLIKVIDNFNDKVMFTLLYFSSLRIGEFLGIKVKDISFDNKKNIALINISRQKLQINGRLTSRLKTSSSYKTIIYTNNNVKLLKEYLEVNNLIYNQEAILFNYTNSGIRKKLKRYCLKASIPYNTIHGFSRKSINTELYNAGASSKSRKTLLGQASDFINENNYIDNNKALEEAAKILKKITPND